MKYLWVSNGMNAPTGYGQQTGLFVPRIKRSERDIALFAFYGCQGAPFQTVDGILVLPCVVQPFGNDIAFGYFQYTQSDIAITLIDPHALATDVYRQFPTCMWTPIDSAPLIWGNLDSLKVARWVWSMSQFGDAEIRKAGFDPIYVPHGIDSKVFVPADRAEGRRNFNQACQVNIGDKFLVAMNAANKGTPSRKGFYEAFAAFKAFSDRHDDALLYVHSEQMGAFQGENLLEICKLLNLDPIKVIYAPQFMFVSGMLGADYVAGMYNAADVFLSASHGEGFGIPSVEAQLCGTPVILPRNSAQTELCLTGRLVDCTTYMPVTGTTWGRPIVSGLVAALEWAYQERGNLALRNEARERALVYDADRVFDTYMKPALERMERELYAPVAPQKITRKRQVAATGGNGSSAHVSMSDMLALEDKIYGNIADAIRESTYGKEMAQRMKEAAANV